MDNENHIQIIEEFLIGNISREEAIKEGDFSSGATFDQAVEDYHEGLEGIRDMGLENELKKIHQKLYSPKPKQSFTKRGIVAAASIILLGVFGFLFLDDLTEAETDFDSYFQPYPNYDLMRNKDTDALDKAIGLYVQQKFDSAQLSFLSVKMDTLNYDYSFYLGMTYLVNREFSKASEILKSTLSEDHKNPYYQQTHWYLALAYWQNNQAGQAISELELIRKDQFKYDEAQRLLEQLR